MRFRNMDGLVFGEFAEHLSKELKKALDEEGKDDTLSVDSLLKPRPPPEKSPDEDEFLKLHDGNYLKAKEAGELDPDSPSIKETGV